MFISDVIYIIVSLYCSLTVNPIYCLFLTFVIYIIVSLYCSVTFNHVNNAHFCVWVCKFTELNYYDVLLLRDEILVIIFCTGISIFDFLELNWIKNGVSNWVIISKIEEEEKWCTCILNISSTDNLLALIFYNLWFLNIDIIFMENDLLLRKGDNLVLQILFWILFAYLYCMFRLCYCR